MSKKLTYHRITKSAFEKEILHADLPVIVEFGADWSGSCQIMTPIIDSLSHTYKDRIKIIRLDITRNVYLVKRYNIQAVPTYYFIKNGRVVDQILRAAARDVFERKIKALLSGSSNLSSNHINKFNGGVK